MVIRREIAVAAWAVLAAACAATTPHPPYMAQADGALVEVGRPPPPARVETVPPSPAAGAVWIDGEWIWRRAQWAWRAGRWVMAPAGAAFAPWAFVRGADGRLWYAPGVWRKTGGGPPIDPPSPLAVASVQGGAVVGADGLPQTTGPVVGETAHAHAGAR
jgi:hypothetical protein